MASTIVDRLDGLSSAAAFKGPCRVASLSNLTLSGLQTVDGVSLVAGDRVLVRSQSDTTENGIYVVSASNWRRAKDFNGSRDVTKGTRVNVVEGSTQAGRTYAVSSEAPVVVGTDDINFENVTVEGVQADEIDAIEVLTQAEYNALSPPDSSTLYVVVG